MMSLRYVCYLCIIQLLVGCQPSITLHPVSKPTAETTAKGGICNFQGDLNHYEDDWDGISKDKPDKQTQVTLSGGPDLSTAVYLDKYCNIQYIERVGSVRNRSVLPAEVAGEACGGNPNCFLQRVGNNLMCVCP